MPTRKTTALVSPGPRVGPGTLVVPEVVSCRVCGESFRDYFLHTNQSPSIITLPMHGKCENPEILVKPDRHLKCPAVDCNLTFAEYDIVPDSDPVLAKLPKHKHMRGIMLSTIRECDYSCMEVELEPNCMLVFDS